MPVLATDSFYLFRDDGLEGPYSPVQLRIMLDSGQIGKDIYCQPQNGGPTQVLREIFDDPESFQSTRRTSPGTLSAGLDPFASGDVPLMGDTLPLQSGIRDIGQYALRDAPQTSSRYRAAHHPSHDFSSLILDATHTDTPFERESAAEPETVYHGHPSYLSYTRSVAVVLIAMIAGILALPFAGTIATVSGFAIAFLILAGVWADRSFADYVVTTRRVEVITGVISRSSNEVKICDIRTINVDKSGFLGLLGIGSVEFASSGGDEIEIRFKNIRGAHKVKHLVRQLQDSL